MPALEDAEFNGRCPKCLAGMVVDLSHPVTPFSPRPIKPSANIIVVVDNVRSGYNVGAILRTSECLGVRQVYLCGITPDPSNSAVQKSAVGAQELLHIEACNNTLLALEKLRQQNYQIWALELSNGAVEINSLVEVPQKVVLVVGNERCGIDPAVIETSDKVVYIPMAGIKNSLNVEVSFGIALDQLRSKPVSG